MGSIVLGSADLPAQYYKYGGELELLLLFRNRNDRLMTHGEVYRPRDKAVLECISMRREGGHDHRFVGHHDPRFQHYLGKRSPEPLLLQHPDGGISVLRHDDARPHRHVQVRQHVALRKRGDEQLFGVPTILVAVKRRVCRRFERRLVGCVNEQFSPVIAISGRAGASVTDPLDLDTIFMLIVHVPILEPAKLAGLRLHV